MTEMIEKSVLKSVYNKFISLFNRKSSQPQEEEKEAQPQNSFLSSSVISNKQFIQFIGNIDGDNIDGMFAIDLSVHNNYYDSQTQTYNHDMIVASIEKLFLDMYKKKIRLVVLNFLTSDQSSISRSFMVNPSTNLYSEIVQ